MKRISLVLLLALTIGSCQNKYPDLPNGVYAEIITNKGTFVAKLYNEATPLTVANFVSLAQGTNQMVDDKHKGKKFYDSVIFHRVIKDFMIQGGDFENHDGSGGYAADWYGYCNGQSASNQSTCNQNSWTIPDEADNGLLHKPCAISMAKTSAANTGGSQFFIIPEDSNPTHLNGVHTVFGKVTEGCEHITTISEVATEGSDRPILPVIIYSATVDN